MASRHQRAPLRPEQPRVPKAARAHLEKTYNEYQSALRSWQKAVELAAGFLEIDPSKVRSIDFDSGLVTMVEVLPEPTPITPTATETASA